MTTRTVDDFTDLDDENSTEEVDEPDLSDYKAFEMVLNLTRDSEREQFIRDLLDTTSDIRNEHAVNIRNNTPTAFDSSDKPSWLKNTKRPLNDNIHDHFMKYKEASSTIKFKNCYQMSNCGASSMSERPLTRGEFFDDVISQLFEENNGNNDYNNLDLTGIDEAEDREYNDKKKYTKSEKDVESSINENASSIIDNNYTALDDTIYLRNDENLIGLDGKDINATEANREGAIKNQSAIERNLFSNTETELEKNEHVNNLREFQRQPFPEANVETNKIPQFQKENILDTESNIPAPLTESKYRPTDILKFMYMDKTEQENESDIVFQNSDEDED